MSHWPIIYGFFGGVGVVLFWRGVWYTADVVYSLVAPTPEKQFLMSTSQIWDGPISIVAGAILLLMSGLFVSNFIGNEIIISGLRGEKKLTEKTEVEVRTETGAIAEIKEKLDEISARLEELEKKR